MPLSFCKKISYCPKIYDNDEYYPTWLYEGGKGGGGRGGGTKHGNKNRKNVARKTKIGKNKAQEILSEY